MNKFTENCNYFILRKNIYNEIILFDYIFLLISRNLLLQNIISDI